MSGVSLTIAADNDTSTVSHPLWSRLLLLAGWIPHWILLLVFGSSCWSQQEPKRLSLHTHLPCRHLILGDTVSIQGVSNASKLQLFRSSGTSWELDCPFHCEFFHSELDEFHSELWFRWIPNKSRREDSFLRRSFASQELIPRSFQASHLCIPGKCPQSSIHCPSSQNAWCCRKIVTENAKKGYHEDKIVHLTHIVKVLSKDMKGASDCEEQNDYGWGGIYETGKGFMVFLLALLRIAWLVT